MKNDIKAPEKKWQDFHIEKASQAYPKWPNEAMLKVLFGDYLIDKPSIDSNKKVLDIGCGFGNNLLPFLDSGCQCFGVEITEEMARTSSEILSQRGYSACIKKGNNLNLPFESDMFDIITSLNVLHYEKNEKDLMAALKEYCRVLKPDGMLYLCTVGPQHTIYQKAEVVGPHQFMIKDWDFRNGEQYFYFSNLKYFQYYLDKFFHHVELGRVIEKLMKVDLDFLIAVARKKK